MTYQINFEKNFEWAIKNSLISEEEARRIRYEGRLEDTFSGRVVCFEALGRRLMYNWLVYGDYNVPYIVQHPVFNEEGDYSISIDTTICSGSTLIPCESKFRNFELQKYPDALITADKWDELKEQGGFLFYAHPNGCFLWNTAEVKPVWDKYLLVSKRTEDPYCKEKVWRRNYGLRYEDAFRRFILE